MATSPNYGWAEPDNTDLVKNGALAIRTLGNAIDTSVWNIGYGKAGGNKIINGNFGVWQRGTSFTNPGTSGGAAGYTADRWAVVYDANPNWSVSQQTFTPGTAPVAGYEGTFFGRFNAQHTTTSTYRVVIQKIEDVRTFAGQTVTLSFWAKTTSNFTLPSVVLQQDFGSGGSGRVDKTLASSVAITTSWQRFSYTIALDALTGKTIGISSFLTLGFGMPLSSAAVLDLWGVQLEYGSKVTPFQTASGGSIQGELAMCQRYYWRQSSDATAVYAIYGNGIANSTTNCGVAIANPVQMRTTPTTIDAATLQVNDGATVTAVTAAAIVGARSTSKIVSIDATVAAGLTVSRGYIFGANNSSSSYIGFGAEL
jgi:hypothetical protein